MRSSREEKVNAFTAEETPLSRIRATAKAKAKNRTGRRTHCPVRLERYLSRTVAGFLSTWPELGRSPRRGEDEK